MYMSDRSTRHQRTTSFQTIVQLMLLPAGQLSSSWANTSLTELYLGSNLLNVSFPAFLPSAPSVLPSLRTGPFPCPKS